VAEESQIKLISRDLDPVLLPVISIEKTILEIGFASPHAVFLTHENVSWEKGRMNRPFQGC
jgi:hypothetical protein